MTLLAEIAAVGENAIRTWRDLPLDPFSRGVVKAVIVFGLYFAIIRALERANNVHARYKSRAFSHDVAYWFYYCAGIHRVIFLIVVFGAIEEPLAFLDFKAFTSIPFPLQALLYFILFDFISYWTHRAQHHFKFLWAFHTTHHSQEELTFATAARFHPGDRIVQDVVTYCALRVIGVDPLTWLPLALTSDFLQALIHSRVPWTYGPLYRVFVSPRYHAYHHSTEPMHHNKHFAGIFPAWDYLFGTTVTDAEPAPTRFGLDGWATTSFLATLTVPFALLQKFYGRDRAKQTAAI